MPTHPHPSLSEDGILKRLSRHFPDTHDALLIGRGDDCAMLRPGGPLCVSTDLFLEDVHFRRSYFTPADIGYKALAVNTSDLAACGARPLAFTLALGLPGGVDDAWLDAFFSGMAEAARPWRMALAGGDLSRCDRLSVSITVWGEAYGAPENAVFLARGGAMPGDSIFLVGQVGLARVGLAVLEKQGRAACDRWPAACAAHLRPLPRVDAGLMLARAGSNARPPVLMDVSDGLARDLPRLLGRTGNGNAFGAALLLPRGRLHPEVNHYAEAHGLDPVEQALLGGEDYALLGACAPDMLPPLHAAIPDLWTIGVVTEEGLTCNNRSLEGLEGFDHFREEAAHV